MSKIKKSLSICVFMMLALTMYAQMAYAVKTVAPTFSPSGGTYTSPITVRLSSTTPNAYIYYRINDGALIKDDKVNAKYVTLGYGTWTLKSNAWAPGYSYSDLVTQTYTITMPSSQPAVPTFSPDGGVYINTLVVNMRCATAGASIYYTTDGFTNPTKYCQRYTGLPVVVNTSTTLMARAYYNGVYSDIKSTRYTIVQGMPVFSPDGGTYTGEQNVKISSIPGATIRYTTNGNDPTDDSPIYRAGEYVYVDGDMTLKAIAYANGRVSGIKRADYIIKPSMPTFSPDAGNYSGEQKVYISSQSYIADYYYTTDGVTIPTTNSTRYNGSITVDHDMTLRAIAYNGRASDVKSATYTIKLAKPYFRPDGGTYNSAKSVHIYCENPDVTIYYTKDKSDPRINLDRLTYDGSSIAIYDETTLKAYAKLNDNTVSDVAVAAYYFKINPISFSPGGGNYNSSQNVKISCSTPNAIIYYTTDGSEPADERNTHRIRYYDSSPVTINSPTTLKAAAVMTGWISSSKSADYSFDVLAPKFDPSSGSITSRAVTVTCDTPGAVIHYTRENRDPTESDLAILSGDKISITKQRTIRAKAWKNGIASSTASAAFTEKPSATNPTKCH